MITTKKEKETISKLLSLLIYSDNLFDKASVFDIIKAGSGTNLATHRLEKLKQQIIAVIDTVAGFKTDLKSCRSACNIKKVDLENLIKERNNGN